MPKRAAVAKAASLPAAKKPRRRVNKKSARVFAIKAAHDSYKHRRMQLKKAETRLRRIQRVVDNAADEFGDMDYDSDFRVDRSGDWSRYDRQTRNMLYDDARARHEYYDARDELEEDEEELEECIAAVEKRKKLLGYPQRFAIAATVLPGALPDDLVREVLLFAFSGAKKWYADGDAAVIAATAPRQAAVTAPHKTKAAVVAPVKSKAAVAAPRNTKTTAATGAPAAKKANTPIAAKAPRKKAKSVKKILIKLPRAALIKRPKSKVYKKAR